MRSTAHAYRQYLSSKGHSFRKSRYTRVSEKSVRKFRIPAPRWLHLAAHADDIPTILMLLKFESSLCCAVPQYNKE